MSIIPTGELSLEGDPRVHNSAMDANPASVARRPGAVHDPSVSLEEYMFYAALNRANEERMYGANSTAKNIAWKPDYGTDYDSVGTIARLQGGKVGEKELAHADEKGLDTPPVDPDTYLGVSNEEWAQAARAARTATWGAIFYLITTDILGPFTVPWAIGQMGWGPGVTLFFVFGALAFYAGFQMWQMFMVLDSDKYPCRTYSDLAFRTMGPYARHGVNILQSIQLFFNVGILILGDGQAIYQMSMGPNMGAPLCFVVCNIVFTIAGFLLGQIRTLARFSWIANFAIWINVTIMIITMAIVATTPPNYAASNAQNLTPLTPDPADQPPVMHYAGANPDVGFQGQLVGLMQAVYSYGGAMLYCEFMSEMKKPWDFFKAQFFAECFIFTCYVFFGCFIYGYQGQYTIFGAYPGISNYNWQTATNALSLVSALIAAALYGNIGIKVVYEHVLKELFNFPPLETKAGKLIWVGIVPVYWILAFIVCSAIPNITNFSGLIGGLCIMQFSYTFPPIMMFFLDCQRDAILPEESFDPSTGEVHRVDHGWTRFKRGFFAKRVILKIWYILFAAGALTTAVLGVYSSISALIDAFKNNPNVTSFGCDAPI